MKLNLARRKCYYGDNRRYVKTRNRSRFLGHRPEESDIESGTRSKAGLQAYKVFIEAYSLGRVLSKQDLLHIPGDVEDAFLRKHSGIDRETWNLGRRAFQNIQKYGSPDWYDWRRKHWNTKWDAGGYDENTDYSLCDRLVFRTAWQEPAPVIQKLSEMYPDIEFTHRWAEEQLGHYCGTAMYLAGEQTGYELMQENETSTEFALGLWHQLNTNGTPMDQGQMMQ